jgi:hypothetical protein
MIGAVRMRMLKCPICSDSLTTKTSDGWMCRCGEPIPFGMEADDTESWAHCQVMNCPRRK